MINGMKWNSFDLNQHNGCQINKLQLVMRLVVTHTHIIYVIGLRS